MDQIIGRELKIFKNGGYARSKIDYLENLELFGGELNERSVGIKAGEVLYAGNVRGSKSMYWRGCWGE